MSSVVSIAAPFVSTVQMLPQLHKIYATDSIAGVSQHMLMLALATNALWTLHGVNVGDTSLIVAGVIAAVINALIIEKFYRVKRVGAGAAAAGA